MSDRAVIPPVGDGKPRPRWTVLIPTYNTGPYLEEAIASVLAQDSGPDMMEIIVVDDHSTRDDPEAVVNRVGKGRVRFIRQKANVGKVRNYATGLLASRGELIHQLHADDRIRPGFYSAMEAAFGKFPGAGAFFCESFYIDESGDVTGRTGKERPDTGLVDGFLEKIVAGQRIQTPSIVVPRHVYESLGGFDGRLDMVEDWEMWTRIATSYPIGFVAEPLAEYRASPEGATVKGLLSGQMVSQTRTMLSIVDEYLPRDVLERQRDHRDRELAQALTQFIPFLVDKRHFGTVARTWLDVLRFSAHPRAIYRLLYFTLNYRRFLKAE